MTIDVTKPLYLDGERVYLVGGTRPTGESSEDFWARIWEKNGYINVSKYPFNGPYNSQPDNSSFHKESGKFYPTDKLQGTLSNSKDNNMVDFTKALVVDDKDAKIIHTFDNGNIAVVVDGKQNIYTYNSKGQYLSGNVYGVGSSVLKNKVEVTVRYLNVYPDSDTPVFIYITPSGAKAGIGQSRERGTGFTVKQTLHDGKVVSTEIVDG